MSLSERRTEIASDDQITALSLAQSKVLAAFTSRSKRRSEAMATLLERRSAQQARVLFDDEWLTPAESRRRYRRLRNQQFLQVLELLAVMVVLVVAAGLCFGLLLLLYW